MSNSGFKFTKINSINLGDQRSKSYLMLIATILIVVIFVVVAIRPTVLKITEITAENQRNKDYLAAIKAKNEELQKISQLKNDVENYPKIQAYLQAIPQSEKFHELLANIEILAKQTGVTVSNVSSSPVSGFETAIDSSLVRTNVVITASASDYNSLKQFSQLISNYPRIKKVESLNFGLGVNRTSQAGGVSRPTMSISFKTYHYPKLSE